MRVFLVFVAFVLFLIAALGTLFTKWGLNEAAFVYFGLTVFAVSFLINDAIAVVKNTNE